LGLNAVGPVAAAVAHGFNYLVGDLSLPPNRVTNDHHVNSPPMRLRISSAALPRFKFSVAFRFCFFPGLWELKP